MPALEIAKRTAIINFLKRKGAYVLVTTGVAKAGTPDIIACYRGYFLAFEVKREQFGDYGATKKQRHELKLIRVSGGEAYIVVEVDEVRIVLDRIDRLFMADVER